MHIVKLIQKNNMGLADRFFEKIGLDQSEQEKTQRNYEEYKAKKAEAFEHLKVTFDDIKALDGKAARFTQVSNGYQYVAKIKAFEEPSASNPEVMVQKVRLSGETTHGEGHFSNSVEGWGGRTDTTLANLLVDLESIEEVPITPDMKFSYGD